MERQDTSSHYDWTHLLTASDRATIRRLPFAPLARIPPPKRHGLPLGHELRIFGRFLTGRSSSLDPSGLASIYRSWLAPAERSLLRALVLREPAPSDQWAQLLGDSLGDWRKTGHLVEEDGGLRCRFAVVPLRNRLFVVDPQEGAYDGKVHIGQDSLNLLEFAARRPPPAGGRLLDVGTGSGVLLIGLGGEVASAVGVDINPRAVRAARFNAALNDLSHVTVDQCDVFERAHELGRFDLVIWNTPFMFFPEQERETNLDGYGGHLGIELTLRFVERLPELLTGQGRAILLTSAPILASGENRLADELTPRGERLRLDLEARSLQPFWVPRLADFYRGHNIDHFESTVLEVRPGTGRYRHHGPSAGQRVARISRGLLYRLRRGS